MFEWHDIGDSDLDYTHSVAVTLTVTGDFDWNTQGLLDGDLVLRTSLPALLRLFSQWRAGQLRELAHAHELRVLARDSASSILERLTDHLCGRSCPVILVVFRALHRRRTAAQVARHAIRRTETVCSSQSYTEVASEELRRTIICEWQDTISTKNFVSFVCGPCGRRIRSALVSLIPPTDFDLSLLRNDGLPLAVRPTTYNFDAYGEALLDLKGLVNRWELDAIRMCETCRKELVDKQRMPRLSLANWLYYGRDELPPEVKRAFDASTATERVLLGRARCSRVSFRFSELRKRADDVDGLPHVATGSKSDFYLQSQRCIKGNVLIMPQNSTHLNSVLPPGSDIICDTVCAVFVGKSKPTKKTIGKLAPLLVRKSRMITLIDFIMGSNAHYATDSAFHGFSQRNLDELFGPGTEHQDEGISCALEVGFIEDSDAIRAAVSDYTDRGDVNDDLPDGDTLLMENVGYTMGDERTDSIQDMKLKALAHCLAGGKFIRSQAGDRFVPDFDNPCLLTWLFLHLDPWGIGGFHEPAQEIPITMEEQLKYLLELDDSPFERDPDFTFVYYNIMQKKAVCDSVRFRVKVADQRRIVRELLSVDRRELERLITIFKSDPQYEPQTDEQRRLVSLVNKIGTMLHDLPGTAGYKLRMRNEIRALVNMKGTPAFFITLNPSDIHHPLVRLLAGDQIQLESLQHGQELKDWQHMEMVANKPGACARFFHTMISSFISIVLRYGKPGRGLLGKCTAYYGTVETQGRGTLHCHMLVWLHGHPSPQQMRDMMLDSTQYQSDLFRWLESLIKCELLGTTMLVNESDGPLPRPKYKKAVNYVNPSTVTGPSIDKASPETFALQYASDVNDLVIHSNWHQHTDTCWKYLRRGEPRTDENCRMRMDGTTREETLIDEATGLILLRRLHPRIANYNNLIIFLLRANMELKHIGSGEGAKALIYYITDYITKASLPTHVGLSALLCAINRTRDKYRDVPDWEETRSGGALTVVVNSMMARQEIPHQQVMSYLVGGGDHYKSKIFRVLHYGSFERLVLRYWLAEEVDFLPHPPASATAPSVSESGAGLTDRAVNPGAPHPASVGGTSLSPDPYVSEPPHDGCTTATSSSIDVTSDCLESLRRPDDNITLVLGAGSISAANQQNDYLYRPSDEPFASMGLYEYVGMSEKITKDAESRRVLRRKPSGSSGRHCGRPEESRADFSPEHPQCETHLVRRRTVWVVPVILGDRIPRSDRTDEERERWSRAILTLFKPWRHPADLKESSETWYEAYERYAPAIAPEHLAIIRNMNVLSECRDARDKATLARRLARNPVSVIGDRPPSPDPYDVFDSEANRTHPRGVPDDQMDECDVPSATLLSELDRSMGTRFRHAVDLCFSSRGKTADESQSHGTAALLLEENRARLVSEHAAMRLLKRKRRPDHSHEHVNDADRNVRPRLNRPPVVDTMSLDDCSSAAPTPGDSVPVYDPQSVMYQVVLEKNLRSNPEQLRAFDIVGKHLIHGGDQLLMYIGGVGGTGKSHVVNLILRLFSLLGKSKRILVAAPTGAAAILIGGHTIHSLTLLPGGNRKDLQELYNIWKGVDYLILDEISMIGARFMSQLNARLQRAKGYTTSENDLPFGGLNVIFTGDFGQLKPVRDPPLYSHSLVSNPDLEACRGKSGISALMGVYLWRRVNTVVLLKINQRQAQDSDYAALLSRIRRGEARTTTTPTNSTDYAVLRTRYADRVMSIDGASLAAFRDAPIIVGRKRLRDLLNLRIMGHHAQTLSAEIHLYNARDRISGHEISESERQILWKLSSTVTHDSLGKIPLFPGMKVMVQENLAFSNRVVNGTEGIVKDIVFEEEEGIRYPAVVYVHVPGAGSICSNAVDDIVPIFPEWTSFQWVRKMNGVLDQVSVSRLQVPLLLAYAYTDYKSQDRSLDWAIIDPASASTLQGVYVMLSRVRALKGLVILRPFKPEKIEQRMSQELRNELLRIDNLDTETRRKFPIAYGLDDAT